MKLFLAVFILGIFTLNVQAQWYSKSFGVDSITDLNEAQLNYLYQRAESNIKTGKIATFAGAGTFFLGAILAVNGANNWVFNGGNINQLDKVTAGSLLMVAGMGSFAVGVPFWIVGANRKKKIEIVLVQMKYSSFTGYPQPQALGLSLKIHF
jgi:hypothetical protein